MKGLQIFTRAVYLQYVVGAGEGVTFPHYLQCTQG